MRSREVRQDIALLLLQRRHHRQHVCDKARALFTLRAKTALAPQHAWTERALCRVVRRFDAVDLPEGPPRLAPLHNLLAGPFGLGPPPGLPASQSRSTSQRSGGREERKVDRFTVPSRTRCPHENIWCACASQASPISSQPPPRPRIASQSRRPGAQHSCRPRTGYQW
jgi:hypothetical protein